MSLFLNHKLCLIFYFFSFSAVFSMDAIEDLFRCFDNDDNKICGYFRSFLGLGDFSKFLDVDNNKTTILHIVCQKGFQKTAQFLCKTVSQTHPVLIPNYQNAKGQTALHFAVLGGHKNVAVDLCSFGADPNILDSHYKTPFLLAIETKNYILTKHFLESYYINFQIHNDFLNSIQLAFNSEEASELQLTYNFMLLIDEDEIRERENIGNNPVKSNFSLDSLDGPSSLPDKFFSDISYLNPTCGDTNSSNQFVQYNSASVDSIPALIDQTYSSRNVEYAGNIKESVYKHKTPKASKQSEFIDESDVGSGVIIVDESNDWECGDLQDGENVYRYSNNKSNLNGSNKPKELNNNPKKKNDVIFHSINKRKSKPQEVIEMQKKIDGCCYKLTPKGQKFVQHIKKAHNPEKRTKVDDTTA